MGTWGKITKNSTYTRGNTYEKNVYKDLYTCYNRRISMLISNINKVIKGYQTRSFCLPSLRNQDFCFLRRNEYSRVCHKISEAITMDPVSKYKGQHHGLHNVKSNKDFAYSYKGSPAINECISVFPN